MNLWKCLSAKFLVRLFAIGATAQAAPETKPVVFAVSDVQIATKVLATRPADEILHRSAGDEMEAASSLPGDEWIAPLSAIRHPFIAAAHKAFAEHRPLALSPDMIWLLLTQMAAAEVQAHPEQFRECFAIHEHGQRTLKVRRDEFVARDPKNDWPGVFAELEAQIVRNVPSSPVANFSHAFSTSTPVEITARRAVLLNAASPFYQFRVTTFCGIPRMELHGTTDDWRWIRSHLADLSKLGMNRRVDALVPVLDQFVAAAEGHSDAAFWRSFYKYDSESGGSYVSGWINLFFIAESDKRLDAVLDKNFTWSAAPVVETGDGAFNLPLDIDTIDYKSNGAVDVDFVWESPGSSLPMLIRAGFMGVSQDSKALTLKPAIAWQVLRRKQSSEERLAMDFLSGLGKLGFFEMKVIERDFEFDPQSGRIKVTKRIMSGTIDSRFWRKAFPLMGRLETLEPCQVLRFVTDDKERKARCEAMLSAPFVTKVIVLPSLEDECLRILKGRTDWKIEVAE